MQLPDSPAGVDPGISAAEIFDVLAKYSNGDPIPRPLCLNIRLERIPNSVVGLDLLLLEAELLAARFDRDRDVVGVTCRTGDPSPTTAWLQHLFDSLSRRFHFSSRPPAVLRLQVESTQRAESFQLLEQSGWIIETGPPWYSSLDSAGHDTLPLGPAASACLGGCVFHNESSLDDYAAALHGGRLPIGRREERSTPRSALSPWADS